MMKIIECISNDMENEIDRAECYAKRALEYKAQYPSTAEHYYKVASDGVTNILNNFHAAVVELIDAYKKEKGAVPESMQMLYNILHKKHMEHLAAVKGMLSLYKEM